jgi:hypothetical protein
MSLAAEEQKTELLLVLQLGKFLLESWWYFARLRHYSISPHVCETDKAVHNTLLYHENCYTPKP